jgi:CspA family cold shock protein
MQTGVVKFFNPEKHFGFITMDGTGEQVFVHQSGLKTQVRENDKVVFEVEKNAKGPYAVNVELAPE